MGAFFYASNDTAGLDRVLKESRRHFRMSGFADPICIRTSSYCLDYYPKFGSPVINFLEYGGNSYILSVGTFIYKRLVGTAALSAFYEDGRYLDQLGAARGHFTVILRDQSRTLLLPDLLGSYEIFVSRDRQCITSSFLAAAFAQPHPAVNSQEAYEYVFNGGSFGRSTPIAGVRRLGAGEYVELEPTCRIVQNDSFSTCPVEQRGSFQELVNSHLHSLTDYTRSLKDIFDNRIKLALSGGYDSRLLFALFRSCGVTPEIFVYGSSDDPDVRAAMHITKSEELPLHHLDKKALRKISPHEYPEIVYRNFWMEDGLPSGGILTPGAELIARMERSEGGALHVNGGGGEIFRNFFNLRDRPVSVRHFIWLFFRQFSPAECAGSFSATRYDAAMEEKIMELLPQPEAVLSRRQAESLYPYFRCRSWFARENSVNNRWGYSVLPFFDYRTVQLALQIPIRHKYFGNFESAMIRSADPKLASYQSNYGHSFAAAAPLGTVLRDLATYARPAWLRRESFRIRMAMNCERKRPALLSQDYVSKVIDTRFPITSKYFNRGSIASDVHYARLCTLEYMFGRLFAT